MKIKEIIDRHRIDFYAIYECEHCGNEHKGDGYDDANFHQNVIPKMKCPECKKTADETYRPMAPKYQSHEII